MTLDQGLLTGLVFATIAGVVIALLAQRRQAKWRQRDLLSDFIGTWAAQVGLPTEVDALRFEEDLTLQVEQDARFPLAFKLVSKQLQRQYKEFIRGRSTYIAACHKLYDQIKLECEDRTGLPVGTWRDTENWLKGLLLSNFVRSIYEQALGTKQNTFRLEDISYDVSSFSHSGQGFTREGLHLTTTYDAYSGLDLAEAGDKATLERIQFIHRQMMEMDYCKKFVTEVQHIGHLQREAETLAHNVREALRRLQVS